MVPSGNSEQPGVAGAEYVCLRVYTVNSVLVMFYKIYTNTVLVNTESLLGRIQG